MSYLRVFKSKNLLPALLFFSVVLGTILSTSTWAKPSKLIENLCAKTTEYDCIDIQENQTWASLWPNPEDMEKVRKINRINLKLRKGMKIAVPKNLTTATLLDFSPLPRQMPAPDKKSIVVDLTQLAWGAYDAQGNLVNWGPASGGKNWCPDTKARCRTPAGTFPILFKQGAGCKSGKFPIPRGGAPMPYCMNFTSVGHALHGSNDVPGYNASHGCVRLFTEDAKWLNQSFIETPKKENSYQGTPVVIQPY